MIRASVSTADVAPADRLVNLHVAHSWGGGLGRWVRDFAVSDPHSENLVLESIGTRSCFGLGLRLRDAKTGELLANWLHDDPIAEVRQSHEGYERLLAGICRDFGVSRIIVSSLIGHTLGVFRQGLPLIQVHHDYFSYCPAVFLFFDGVCSTCTAPELERCKATNPGFFRPKNSPAYYRDFRTAYFQAVAEAKVRHVAPSLDVPRNLCRIDSRFQDLEFRLIEHGLCHAPSDTFGGAEEGRRLRVGLLGHLNHHKGLVEICQLFETARVIVDLHLLGAHDPAVELSDRWGVQYVHEYAYRDLPQLLARQQLDLALFLSTVPETFSYTLSEAWCFCVPPAAWPVGAFGERITDGRDGFFLPPGNDGVIDFLLWADRERDALRTVAAHLRRKPVRTVRAAIDDYYRLGADDSTVTRTA